MVSRLPLVNRNLTFQQRPRQRRKVTEDGTLAGLSRSDDRTEELFAMRGPRWSTYWPRSRDRKSASGRP